MDYITLKDWAIAHGIDPAPLHRCGTAPHFPLLRVAGPIGPPPAENPPDDALSLSRG